MDRHFTNAYRESLITSFCFSIVKQKNFSSIVFQVLLYKD
nr:MAG TPA: hypothetical protein [Caudoviricetes sp.]